MSKCDNILCINYNSDDECGCDNKFELEVKECKARLKFELMVDRIIGWKSLPQDNIRLSLTKKEVYDYIIYDTKQIID